MLLAAPSPRSGGSPIQPRPSAGARDETAAMRGTEMPPPARRCRCTEPPVASAIGRSRSVVLITSWNSTGLAGPIWASAVSVPSSARCRPSGASSTTPRQRPGSASLMVSGSASPVGPVTVHLPASSPTGSAAPRRGRRPSARAVSASSSSSGSCISQWTQAPEQRRVRAAALVAARPEPGMVGEKHRDAALALARQHEERAGRSGPVIVDVAGDGVGLDEPEPAAPGRRRRAAAAGQVARHRVARPDGG